MATLFVSDLHLDDARPHIVRDFERFCAAEARGAEAVYVLGDLFEAYIGDDDDAPLNARVAGALHGVAATGVPVFYIAGNRDFLLGADYAQRWQRAKLLHAAAQHFMGRAWPCWWAMEAPPTYATRVDVLLWHAARAGAGSLPTTVQRYAQIIEAQ